MTTQRGRAGGMDAVTQQLLQAKDEEMARLAETALRLAQVFEDARTVDRDTRLRLEVLDPEIQHALRVYNRLRGSEEQPD